MEQTKKITKTLEILDLTYPTIPMHQIHGGTPFRLLVAVVLSQRARDAVTVPIAQTLFERIHTPKELQELPLLELETIIKPIGFYQAKAKALKKLATVLVEKYNGTVPITESELLSLPQVGRKTANILLTTFFSTPQIAVDTHVQRITNRLGWVRTKNPLETEIELTTRIPKTYHSIVNRVFVMHGQHICLPLLPKCTQCPIQTYCEKRGVTKYR